MELRNRATGAVITESQFRAEHKNTSFPQVLTAAIIDSFGYDPVLEGPQPALTPPYEIAVRDGVEEVNGQWFTKYIAFEPDADGKAAMDAVQAAAIRQTRDARLAASDWTQLPDAKADRGAWGIYRDALRQVPQQQGFPWEVEWPTEPDPSEQGPDYHTFYNGLLISPAYQAIRAQALSSLPLTVACTEFVAAISDAKLGIPNPPALQAAINNVMTAATLGEAERTELQGLLAAASMDGIYTLPEVTP